MASLNYMNTRSILRSIILTSLVAAAPMNFVSAEDAPDKVAATSSKNILETAVAAGKFKTLAAAIQAAGLTDALNGSGPFTVFAPTDEAFAKLPAGTVESLLKPENKEKLQAILKYHVVAAKVMAKDAIAAKTADTLQGGSIRITAENGHVKINDSKVVKADIVASNGVIHVIDAVLLPAN